MHFESPLNDPGMILPFGHGRRVSIRPRKPLFDLVSKKPKPTRGRNVPTQLNISEESLASLKARLNSAEGQQWLNEFASMIAEWAATAMPTELLQALGARENLDTLKELWPTIVDAYFKALGNPIPRN